MEAKCGTEKKFSSTVGRKDEDTAGVDRRWENFPRETDGVARRILLPAA